MPEISHNIKSFASVLNSNKSIAIKGDVQSLYLKTKSTPQKLDLNKCPW
jgi:hypothetical protein